MKSKKIIHQIFLDLGKKIDSYPSWLENMKINKQLNPDYKYMLWTDQMVQELVNNHYPQYQEFIKGFPHKFYLIDFARYLILDKYGGIYLDLDIRCKKPLPDKQYILGSSYYKPEKVNNNIIKLTKKDYPELISYAVSEFNRIKNNNLYKNWPVRRFMHSLGAGMFCRFCRKNNIKSDIDFRTFFYDEESRSWIGKDGITSTNYHHREVLGLPPK